MRQYGLPADQLAELRASRHGQLLLEEGNTDAPACSDCHDPHTTRPAADVRSSVNPLNISATCAVCHEDDTLMERYGLATDQVGEHRRSRHGESLFGEHNTTAPTCISCHGSHAALPPGVGEIANVCGKCHVNVRRALDEGPHGTAARDGRLPGCTACHSNHGTEKPRSELIASTCVQCHEPNSAPAAVGRDLQERMTRAEEDLEAADQAIHELVRAGHAVENERFGYQTALTEYHQITQVQHSLDMERLEDLGRRVGSISRAIRGTAEVAAEEQWEHKLILIPVWFLALSVVALAWFRLRHLERG
jgi:predicted CXXCH cytochrome family protein